MLKIKLGIISLGIVFLFLGCNNTTTQNSNTTNTAQSTPTPAPTTKSTPDPLIEARAIYAEQCAICHKPDGSGGPATVGKKKVNAASLKTGGAVKESDEGLVKVITNGEEQMPSFKDDLTPEQIKALVQMIRKDFQSGQK